MKPGRSLFWVVFKKELIDSLRDRRALFSMILVPLVVVPLLMVGMGGLTMRMIASAEAKEYAVMILGAENAPELVKRIRKTASLRLVEPSEDFRERISARELQAVLRIPDDFAGRIERGEPEEVTVYVYEGDVASGLAAGRVRRALERESKEIVRRRLAEVNLGEEILHPFSVREENIAPPEKVAGALLGGLLPYVFIMLCITGAIYPALDLAVGEKERGTMETLLSSPVPRRTLVFGKFWVVLGFSVASAFFAVTAMGGSFWLATSGFGGEPGELGALALNPVSLLAFFLLLVPMAALFSGLLLVLSLFARTHREAQTYISPLLLVAILPATVSMMPGVELSIFSALVPVLNVSLIGRDLLVGIYPWMLIGLTLLSSTVYAGIALWFAVRLFEKESVIFRE